MKKEDSIDKKLDETLKKKALDVSIQEGSASTFASGIGDTIISPFALNLSNKQIHIGMLSSFSGLASPLSQIFGSRLMEKYHRKNIVLTFVLLQALTWLPIALIGILFWFGILKSSLIYLLIIFYTLLASFGGIHTPAWFSWMGDLVPENQRGKYFAKRNLIAGIIGLIATLIAAFVIKSFTEDKKMIGFSLLFVISFIFRFISFRKLHKQYSPHPRPRESYNISLKRLKKENKNFKKFAYYQLYLNLAIMIASPFFLGYMRSSVESGGLGFDDFTYLIISMSSSVFYLIFAPLAGKFSDKYGNLKLMYISNFFFVLTPLLWTVAKSPLWIITIPQLAAGIANAALIISYTNFIYDSLAEEKRGVGVAYINVLVGIGTFVGSLAGGFILDYIPITFVNKFFFIFILASVSRLLVALIFMPRLKEEKKVERLPPMYIKLAHPFKAIHIELGHFMTSSRKGLSQGLKAWVPPT